MTTKEQTIYLSAGADLPVWPVILTETTGLDVSEDVPTACLKADGLTPEPGDFGPGIVTYPSTNEVAVTLRVGASGFTTSEFGKYWLWASTGDGEDTIVYRSEYPVHIL